ncbi:hydroxymethylglutaryl-CoA lyase [Azohydromonas caseinilytica]|uniref:Hydroxymethylglutaryl-CoA lyase n=1 Tax=Azohydromonas caseinilytica TaxID=2728836 RepID=A0A848FD98_9BURK|nr:hydroxymethylglutaryl-CoA lyase [Azohydromonas caseinilytica]NML16775.1 hydroxymethylglutaryl-CoA lyase [Azohydromonas caseinilytica]
MQAAPVSAPQQVVVREVGLRDGLQVLARPVPTAFKCDWILLAYAAGLRHIDVGTYAAPGRLPQMADTPEVVAFATTLPDLQVCVQVHDAEGAARAFDAGVAMVTLPISASDRYGQASVGRNAAQMLQELAQISTLRDERAMATQIEAGISTAFSCMRLGHMAPEVVLGLVRESVQRGADQIGLGDTFGHATPEAVRELFQRARPLTNGRTLNAHLHGDDSGHLATVEATLDVGVTHVDASLAGMGGSRLVPGTHGNVSLEAVAELLQRRGVDVGVDRRTLAELRRFAGVNPDALALFGAMGRAAEEARRRYPFDLGTY